MTPPDPDPPDEETELVVAMRATLDGRAGTRMLADPLEREDPNVLALPDELTLSLS